MGIPSFGLIERKGDDGGTGTADVQQGFPVWYAVSSCLSAISFPRETRHPKAGGRLHMASTSGPQLPCWGKAGVKKSSFPMPPGYATRTFADDIGDTLTLLQIARSSGIDQSQRDLLSIISSIPVVSNV
ncbi:acetyl-CoA carboxylase [Aspergillus luchuensis]|uniref:Acetyl-CoA carboxylase n=1 Tax=Aspergillus kawachii TaxID=1069201 RepID=A0A146FME1_ASPKA|nr:acetyl-CoA carboxylase [Aspergillus luchuensis]